MTSVKSHNAQAQRSTISGPAERAKLKQVARIIRHLRDELAPRYPHLAQPTSWMVNNLVFNCPAPDINDGDWQTLVLQSLQYIYQQTDGSCGQRCPFIDIDQHIPLFPNQELFDDLDAHRFAQALIEHLQNELHV